MKALGSSWHTSRTLLRRSRIHSYCKPRSSAPVGTRHYATEAGLGRQAASSVDRKSKEVRARYNAIGVQHLSSQLHPQVFPGPEVEPPSELLEVSKDHLSRHDLLGKTGTQPAPIAANLPPLFGLTLDEHFHRLGRSAAEPYLSKALKYVLAVLPQKPRKWQLRSGWTKYQDGAWEAVEAPDEDMLTFDTEVMYKESQFAVMACAASPTAWYAWLSPWLLGETENDQQLIPLGNPAKERIVVGHNVGYDRARIAEEYDIHQSRNFFLDTMSLHVAVNGMCSRQRPTWIKHQKSRAAREKIFTDSNSLDMSSMLGNQSWNDEEEALWVGRSSTNSLREVAKFHCNVVIDKQDRDLFGELNREQLRKKLDQLLDYCAADVIITHRVYQKVLPGFLETCPHPVSFAALRHLSSVILPIDKSWEAYIQNAEATYSKLTADVETRLHDLARAALALRQKPEEYSNDPWLAQLDWSGQEIRYRKVRKEGDEPIPIKNQKMPGMPQWWKGLFATKRSGMALTVRTRLAPILLRMSWDGYPLWWSTRFGWTFRVPVAECDKYAAQGMKHCEWTELDTEGTLIREDRQHRYYCLPHKDGEGSRVTSPLAKGYLQHYNAGTLSSEFSHAKEALEMNASCSYWISARDRIRTQMAVYEGEAVGTRATSSSSGRGYILPQVVPMGTVTRRAVENTWLTASNAKSNRVGSELKSIVKAPQGYKFVGADVDSQELWIASLLGDAQFQLHGGNAIGFMTLEGTKAASTDLHSKTAKILGISRNDAKVFNYGRIYGAGVNFACSLLRQFNPLLSEERARETAQNLYKETKGMRTTRKTLFPDRFWRGGTESFVFNTLERFAAQDQPRTPALGAGITEALQARYVSAGGFMTSRINWAIQSSGVDYLHLLIVSMDYLISRFDLDARLALTVHDEIRYLVKDEDRYKAAMALQVANIWTRAMFAQQVGINELPQSCAFFSAVDIDHVLRKEVDMDCVTPSHPTKIPAGESLDMAQLLQLGEKASLDMSTLSKDRFGDPGQWDYLPRVSVMTELEKESPVTVPRLKAQVTADDAELRKIVSGLHNEAQRSLTVQRRKTGERRVPEFKSAPPQRLNLPDDWGYNALNSTRPAPIIKDWQSAYKDSLRPTRRRLPAGVS